MSEIAFVPKAEPSAVEPQAAARRPRRHHRKALTGAAALAASVAIGWIATEAVERGADSAERAPALAAAAPRGGAHRDAAPPTAAGRRAAAADPAAAAMPSARVAASQLARSLFAPHTWHIDPPPPPPPPVPPPPPTAPPFPYTVMGAYTPQGGETVYFLSREDRVIDAHVGDHLDGTYVLESADAARLVFNYTPLNIRQSVSAAQP